MYDHIAAQKTENFTRKDRNGWESVTQIDLPMSDVKCVDRSIAPPARAYRNRPLRLDITTSKGTGGAIVTYARVVEPEAGGGGNFSFIMAGEDSDFHKRVVSVKGRATESAIRAAHAEAMRGIEPIYNSAMNHYFGFTTT